MSLTVARDTLERAEIPYWELARTLSRAELDYLTDTDAAVGALAAAGGVGQLNWQLATGASAGEIASVASEDYAPLFTLDAALPASEADAIGLPVTAISQPERLTVGDYAYLVDGSGEIRESVAVLRSSRTCSSCAARTLTICSTGLPNAEPSVALPCLALPCLALPISGWRTAVPRRTSANCAICWKRGEMPAARRGRPPSRS